jgi:hypothetical protein
VASGSAGADPVRLAVAIITTLLGQ